MMADDPSTPAPQRENGLAMGDVEWQQVLSQMFTWAKIHLSKVGIADPGTAEEVVCRAVAKLQERGAYDRTKGPPTPFLWKVVWTEVQEERRRRARRRGDYAAALGDHDALKQLEDSFRQSLSDLDTAWRRQQKSKTSEALHHIRERVTPRDWDVFLLLAVTRRTAPEVVREINGRYQTRPPLDPAKAYRITYRVREVFLEEFHRVGIDPFKDGPDLSELRRELGLADPGESPCDGPES